MIGNENKQIHATHPPRVRLSLSENCNALFQVSYYDQLDSFSCQADCQTNPLCEYFTMFNDDFSAHKKCFHFKECLEPCADCVTGLLQPNIAQFDDKTWKMMRSIWPGIAVNNTF